MNKDLRVASIQLDIVWTDVEQNLINAEEAISRLPKGCDIAVLPEMFSTGFIVERDIARSVCETNSGRTIAKVSEWAKKYNLAVCGSFIACDNEKLYNRAFFVEPSGDKVFYDKRHLFSISGEDKAYNRGCSPMPVFRFRGWNIAMAICFDLRFPVWMRNVGTSYDLMIVMANWPDSRALPWDTLLRARAIENMSYVVGCNRKGTDDYGKYAGLSEIFNPKGRRIAGISPECLSEGTETEPYILSDLSMDDMQRFRSKFPVYREMDTFDIALPSRQE